jgi:hypothetical protein
MDFMELRIERASDSGCALGGCIELFRAEHQAAHVFVLEYLIGTTDWSFALADGDDACCHNGDLLKINGKLNYVPYDFDLAGLINAAYTKPDSSIRIRKVTSRLYRGYCLSPEALQDAIQIIKSKRDDIFAVLGGTPGYSGKDAEKKYQIPG